MSVITADSILNTEYKLDSSSFTSSNSGTPQRIDFTTPGSDSFTVPPAVNSIQIRLWGGGADGTSTVAGGGGAYIDKVISVSPGDVFNFSVGDIEGDTNWESGEFIAGGATGQSGGTVSGSGTPDNSSSGGDGGTVSLACGDIPFQSDCGSTGGSSGSASGSDDGGDGICNEGSCEGAGGGICPGEGGDGGTSGNNGGYPGGGGGSDPSGTSGAAGQVSVLWTSGYLALTTMRATTMSGQYVIYPPVLEVRFADNTVDTSFSGTVAAAIGTNPNSGTLSGTTSVSVSSGIATFSDLSIDNFGIGYTLTFTNADLTTETSGTFTITGNHLGFLQQPTDTPATMSISPAVTVRALDINNNHDTNYVGNVTISITTNPGGGTLSGTNPKAAVAGTATFSNLSINNVGVGYVLTAYSSPLTSIASSSFTITTGPTSSNNSCTLYIYGHASINSGIPLYECGPRVATSGCTLYEYGHIPINSGMSLYELGPAGTSNSGMSLYEYGIGSTTSGIPLYEWGHTSINSGCTLYEYGHGISSSGMTSYIIGQGLLDLGVPLYQAGHLNSTSGMSLYSYGINSIYNGINLYIGDFGNRIEKGMTLYLKNPGSFSGMPLSVWGQGFIPYESGTNNPNSIPLYVRAYSSGVIGGSTNGVSLYTNAGISNNFTLNIWGRETNTLNSGMPLYTRAYDSGIQGGSTDDITLYVNGAGSSSGLPLSIRGRGYSINPDETLNGVPIYGSIYLYINAQGNTNNMPLYVNSGTGVITDGMNLYTNAVLIQSSGIPLYTKAYSNNNNVIPLYHHGF